MNSAAFDSQSTLIQVHVILAFATVVLSTALFSLPKGNRYHRIMGWTWVLFMGAVALTSFGIHTLRWTGPFSPIHLLSILVLVSLVQAVRAARNHRVVEHARIVKSLTVFGLILTGALTFLPGRTMHQIFLGG
jgi:uncharacterized membrane protein